MKRMSEHRSELAPGNQWAKDGKQVYGEYKVGALGSCLCGGRAAMRGMVTSPHHLASQAGLDVLRDGGTAVEACVAVAATLAVV